MPFHSEWDLGNAKNFYQVFGRNFILWPLPVMFQSGRPEGNGIEWEKYGTNSSFASGNNSAPQTGREQRGAAMESGAPKPKNIKPSVNESSHDVSPNTL